jgi:hypothetical protein
VAFDASLPGAVVVPGVVVVPVPVVDPVVVPPGGGAGVGVTRRRSLTPASSGM